MSKTIIILSGGFDPVHKGHIRMFKAAKEFPAKVVVGLNSDSWLIRKKEKPFIGFDERKEILESIRFIDSVYSFNDDDGTACDLIRLIIEENKDSDDIKIYFGNGGDRNKENSPEVDYCSQNNIDIIWNLGGSKIQSSSDLINALKK
tara:strand:- start:689 stop:1129 length:441 start_codon:yes stop_codon:yes gene_type:complete